MKSQIYRVESPGRLPEVGEPVIGGVHLPQGHLISPDPTFGNSRSAAKALPPVAWISDKRLRDIGSYWGRLAETFEQHGLWPLVLETLDGSDDRPWDSGEMDPSSATRPDNLSVDEVLAGLVA